MTHVKVAGETSSRSRLALSPAAVASLWLAGVAVAWWAVTRNQLAQSDLEEAFGSSGMAGAPALGWITFTAVLGRFFMLALEALFYCMWWRGWGARFRWGRFFVAIASLSLIDAWAETLQAVVRDHAASLAAWLAPLLGLALLREEGSVSGQSSLATAFASLGLATVVRIALTARVQAREIGRGAAMPLLLTVSVWLVTRIAVWWGIDLARGMSPVP